MQSSHLSPKGLFPSLFLANTVRGAAISLFFNCAIVNLSPQFLLLCIEEVSFKQRKRIKFSRVILVPRHGGGNAYFGVSRTKGWPVPNTFAIPDGHVVKIIFIFHLFALIFLMGKFAI